MTAGGKLSTDRVLALVAELQPVMATTLHAHLPFVDRSAVYVRLKKLVARGVLVATTRIEGDGRSNYRRRCVYYTLTGADAPDADDAGGAWTPGVWVHPIRAAALGLQRPTPAPPEGCTTRRNVVSCRPASAGPIRVENVCAAPVPPRAAGDRPQGPRGEAGASRYEVVA